MTRDEFDDFLDNGAKSQAQIEVDQYAKLHFPQIIKLIPMGNDEFRVVKSRITDVGIRPRREYV